MVSLCSAGISTPCPLFNDIETTLPISFFGAIPIPPAGKQTFSYP
jgi:hypothetical protein